MASSRVVEVHNRAHFRVGSNASVGRSARDFRFSPINGHRETDPTCLKGAQYRKRQSPVRCRSDQFINSGPTKVLVVMRAPAATMLACLTKPNPRADSFGAKIAQAAAGRRASNTASRQRRGRQVYNRKAFSFSSEAFAGMRITHRHQKEA